MLSFTESFLIARNNRNVDEANETIASLDAEIRRLRKTVNKQAAVIQAHEVQDRSREPQAKAEACSIAGYRAYVEYMRGVCGEDTLTAAVEAYVEALNAKADELKAHHLKQSKPTKKAA